MLHPEEIKQKKILFAALNWGYGHVMRSIVLLKKLNEQQNLLYIVCTEEQKELYLSENIVAEYIFQTGYPFKFSGKGRFSLDLLFSFRKLRAFMTIERADVQRWCFKFGIDIVISDQRMGFYHAEITSVLLTHQLNLPLGWWEKTAQLLYNRWLNHFDFIWIPDVAPPNNLAGKLSVTYRKNVIYIGSLSRFKLMPKVDKPYKFGVLVTGPEPYAQQFFDQQLQRLCLDGANAFIIYNKTEACKLGNVEVINHQTTEKMAEYLCSSELLITRSGYSTLMDIKALGLDKVELHPTIGQAEQVYLAKNWKYLKTNVALQQ